MDGIWVELVGIETFSILIIEDEDGRRKERRKRKAGM